LAYLALLERLDITNVVVVGNSIGGWIAAEMALRRSPRIAAVVLIKAVGINAGPGDRKIENRMEFPPRGESSLGISGSQAVCPPADSRSPGDDGGKSKALMTFAGEPYMHNPSLKARLAEMLVPALVIWGATDGIVDVEYGRRYAESIPGSRFGVIADAGHFPQIEKRDDVLGVITAFPHATPA